MLSFGFRRFKVCEAFGIPVYLDISLALLLLIFAMGGGGMFEGIFYALLLLASITAHEFGHAFTARAFGYETRDITLSLLGGCAALIALPRRAKEEFLTAVAGPAVSFALAILSITAAAAFSSSGFVDVFLFVLSYALNAFYIPVSWGQILAEPEYHQIISFFCSFALMNVMLGVFNMLPGFPLDGGRVFRSAMRSFMTRAQATYIAMVVGRVVAVAIGLRGLYSLVNGGEWGFVSILIAGMIWQEGRREYQLALAEENYRRWTQADFDARVSPPPYEL